MNEPDLVDTLVKHKGFWKGSSGPLVATAAHAPLPALEMPLAEGKAVNEDMPLTPRQLDPMSLSKPTNT